MKQTLLLQVREKEYLFVSPSLEIETWSTQFKQKVNKPKPSEVIQLTPALFPLELLPASMRPKRAPRKKRVEKEAQLFAELGVSSAPFFLKPRKNQRKEKKKGEK